MTESMEMNDFNDLENRREEGDEGGEDRQEARASIHPKKWGGGGMRNPLKTRLCKCDKAHQSC